MEQFHNRFNALVVQEKRMLLDKAKAQGIAPNPKDYDLAAIKRATVLYIHEVANTGNKSKTKKEKTTHVKKENRDHSARREKVGTRQLGFGFAQ